MAALRKDKKSYINAARQRIRDLEQLLLADLEDHGEHRDAGWDAESLRREVGRKEEDAV
jgi:hypothetical protein